MAALLDVNVLVAIVVPEHEHHGVALGWYTSEANQTWATCAVTELGVVRVCAQLPGGAWPPERTADQLLLLTADGRVHEFWPDASSPTVMPEVRTAQTGKQITDRYLLGLARRHGGKLVTFDGGIAAVGGDDVIQLLPLAPLE
ncbi:MAG: PIN domain-containing protein [Acidobacteria bacterium]|nr:PIN domain-containing protein [Acidobacteriota bacterium]